MTTWPSITAPEFADLTPHQRQQLTYSLAGPIGILAGSPGTGKTYTLARLVKAIARIHRSSSVCVCCPTGKAAVRCKEALSSNGVDTDRIEPKTIHRTLGVVSTGEGGWQFEHDESNPLAYRFVILDESSMIGTGLFRSLISAIPRGTSMLLVGDVQQLPPVEYGAPLRDMIAAGIPCGELTEIHRNAGTIVKACAAIRDRRPWATDEAIDLNASEGPKNLVLVNSPRAVQKDRLLNLVRQLRSSPFNVVWDVQVIVATNKKGEVSRKELNNLLQVELNPVGDGAEPAGSFRTADKVIQTKNGFLPLAERGPRGWRAMEGEKDKTKTLICNGEFGRVLAVEEKKLIVQFNDPERIVIVPRGKGKQDGDSSDDGSAASDDDKSTTGCDLELGYAVTCHKMQGSQAPVVIVALDEGQAGAFGVCDRAWLYTAISRAQKACFLVGQQQTADMFCSRQFIGRRKTFMVERLMELAKKEGVVFSVW